MSETLTGLEAEAEELIHEFPKNPLVCADVHSIAVSLKRIADVMAAPNSNTLKGPPLRSNG